MSPEELDAFLGRAADMSGGDGRRRRRPTRHARSGSSGTAPSLWLTSVVRSQRWTDLQRDARIAVVVDAGDDFMELRGVELRGKAAPVGEVPRTGEPVAELDAAERLYADKYAGGQIFHDGRHAWLRVVPDKVVSWDFRKMMT